MLQGEQLRRLYDAMEGISALGQADRCRREYQSRAVRMPERRAELLEELVRSARRHVDVAVELGLVDSLDVWLAETDDELDQLLEIVRGATSG